MSEPERPTLDELRTIDLFDELNDQQLTEWQQVAVIREQPAESVVAEAGADGVREFLLLLKGIVQGLVVEAGRVEPVTRQVAPTWMGAIPVLTETGFAGQHGRRDRRAASRDPGRTTSSGWRSPTGPCTGG